MAYRKFQAKQLFDGHKFLEPGQVLITDERGVVEAIVDEVEAGDGIQKLEGILSPGFINCHCHLELSHMKGRIPEKTGLVDFVFKVVTERHHPEEEILLAIEDAENEMLRNGVVAVGDICNNSLTIPQKQKERLHYYNFIEASGWLPSVSDARFERALNLYEEFSTVNSSIVPHAPYSVSNELWKKIQPYFSRKPVTIHNQETKFEDELFLEGTGDFTRMYEMMKIDNAHHQPTKLSSVQSYFEKMQGASSVLFVHNTFIGEEDIKAIQSSKFKIQNIVFCLCINANQYIEDAVPPVEMLRQYNCNIVLGTDSLASNWSLNILDEIKTIRKHFSSIPTKELLQWATLNGAKALQMDHRLGSFEKGKQPGVILLDKKLESVNRLL
jgi:cytosine/adenosine deaminase-related metal-dependent hydrolase